MSEAVRGECMKGRPLLLLLAFSLLALPAPALSQKSEPVSEEVLGQYRLALLDQFKRVMVYPKEALELQIEGRAVVRVGIGADGRMLSSKVDPSSGYAVLDRAALDMVRKAHPLATLPPALRGRSFEAAVPVTFQIKRE